MGSSAMPHKVNPIDYENSEGNLGWPTPCWSIRIEAPRLAPAARPHRLHGAAQRGRAYAHAVIAFHSTLKGLGKLLLNKEAIDADLNGHWAVLAEAIQTVLRREGFDRPYELLKQLTRTNSEITQQTHRGLHREP